MGFKKQKAFTQLYNKNGISPANYGDLNHQELGFSSDKYLDVAKIGLHQQPVFL
jgi:hypothetical protein